MPTIDFTIKGLAVGYHKEGTEYWNIVFPTDEDHRVKFSYNQGGVTRDPLYLADKSITISSTDSEAPKIYEDESFLKDVIDLTADYLHSDGLMKRNIFLMNVRERSLKIPHATLFSREVREGRLNYVFPFDDPADIRLITDKDNSSKPKLFSMLIGGSINIKEGGKTTIEIEGEEIIDLSAGDSFHFDNDCHGETVRNDFQLYQDIFVNKSTPAKRYEVISIIDPNLFNKLDPDSFKNKLDSDFNIKFMTSPPPLICEFVRISKPDGLD
jgi:hypothetical protein